MFFDNQYITSFRVLLILFFIYLSSVGLCAQANQKSLNDYLDHVMANKEQFTLPKKQRINNLKSLLQDKSYSLEYEFEVNLKLYDEYKKYRLDSAIYYMKKNLDISEALNSQKTLDDCRIKLACLYSFSGMYRESEQLLLQINRSELASDLLASYYDAFHRFYSHYGTVSLQQELYKDPINVYRDSLMSALEPSSFVYRMNQAYRYIESNQVEAAERILLDLLAVEDIDTPDYAQITYCLGQVGKLKNDKESEEKYFTLAAIADVKCAIKENAAFQQLALIYYDIGDVDKAFKYTQSAVEDAVFSGVQYRTAQMAKFYSIINAAYQEKEAVTKSELQHYLLLISFLSIFLIVLFIYTRKQMKKLSDIKEELSRVNDKLIELNDGLNESNEQLSEANHIKEQYIIHFLDLCSDYIVKMENYRKGLNKIALNNQIDLLLKKLKSTALVDQEVEELYKNFDSVFLNLYPTFVADFNSLLSEDEQIVLKSEDLLNKELRIYALLRLGITDSSKIASFLRCSISTVYNYRTKIRNKAIVARGEFEEIIMKIGIKYAEE